MLVTFLVGLPGSGKTHYGNTLGGLFVDDIKDLKELPDSLPDHLVIADVHLCQAKVRERAAKIIVKRYNGCEVEWVFFENNVEKCISNVLARNDGRAVHRMIRQMSPLYEIPAGAVVREIYNAP